MFSLPSEILSYIYEFDSLKYDMMTKCIIEFKGYITFFHHITFISTFPKSTKYRHLKNMSRKYVKRDLLNILKFMRVNVPKRITKHKAVLLIHRKYKSLW